MRNTRKFWLLPKYYKSLFFIIWHFFLSWLHQVRFYQNIYIQKFQCHIPKFSAWFYSCGVWLYIFFNLDFSPRSWNWQIWEWLSNFYQNNVQFQWFSLAESQGEKNAGTKSDQVGQCGRNFLPWFVISLSREVQILAFDAEQSDKFLWMLLCVLRLQNLLFAQEAKQYNKWQTTNTKLHTEKTLKGTGHGWKRERTLKWRIKRRTRCLVEWAMGHWSYHIWVRCSWAFQPYSLTSLPEM